MRTEKKTIGLGVRPKPTAAALADNWVESRGKSEPMRRLTLDVPVAMHMKIKAACAMQGRKMSDVLRQILEQHFAGE